MIHKLFPQLSPVRLGISEKVGRGKRPQLTSKMPCHSLKKKWRKPASGYSESRIRPHDCTNLLHARSHETQHKGNIRRDNHILIMHGCSRGHNNLASRSQEPSDVQKPAKRGNRARSMTERNSPCEASEASWTRGAEGDRLEEGSPIFKQITPFYFKPLSIFTHTTNRISFDLLSWS